jgi:hypothetical protein
MWAGVVAALTGPQDTSPGNGRGRRSAVLAHGGADWGWVPRRAGTFRGSKGGRGLFPERGNRGYGRRRGVSHCDGTAVSAGGAPGRIVGVGHGQVELGWRVEFGLIKASLT